VAAGLFLPLALLLLCYKSNDVWLVAVFAGLIMSLSHDRGPIARLLKSRIIHWLGVVSFALYLVHDLVQKIIFKSLPAWGIDLGLSKMTWVFVSVAISLGIAALAHYYYEKPSRVWARNLITALESRTPVFSRATYAKVVSYVRSVTVRPTTPAE
jgi:peptidoglycan/LPS O-acetylase OafA/YrhL